MQKELRKFFLDGYYAQGIALLKKAGASPTVIKHYEQYLSRNYVPAQIEADLADLLRGYLEDDAVPPSYPGMEDGMGEPDGEAEGKGVRIVGAVSGSFWGALFSGKAIVPEEIWALYERAVQLHKRQANAHPLMVQAARDGKRAEARKLAAEIMDEIIPTLDGIYDAARGWGATGKMPPTTRVDDVVRKTVEKMRRIEYCKQRCSRIRAWLKAGEREVKVEGKKQVVKLDFADRRELEKELLERQLEEKGIREELGIE